MPCADFLRGDGRNAPIDTKNQRRVGKIEISFRARRPRIRPTVSCGIHFGIHAQGWSRGRPLEGRVHTRPLGRPDSAGKIRARAEVPRSGKSFRGFNRIENKGNFDKRRAQQAGRSLKAFRYQKAPLSYSPSTTYESAKFKEISNSLSYPPAFSHRR